MDLDLERLFLFLDLDLLETTRDRERVRLIFLADLERDLLVRDTGVLLRERDLERLPLRTDLERDLEARAFRRETDLFDLDRRGFPTDLDLVRRLRRGDLVLDLLVLVRDLDSERRFLFTEMDLDLRLVPLTDLDRDLFCDGDLERLFCTPRFLLELETDLSLDNDRSFRRAIKPDDRFGVLDRLWLNLVPLLSERDRDLDLEGDLFASLFPL